jgi:hypothetical protein
MAEGFLGRWSQRKQAVREGKALDEPVTEPIPDGGASIGTLKSPAELPPPSLEDVQRLTTESDFKPFVARNVAPEVRNAAMKKLFSDPRYNVMDRLDIYIDDYSKPDPLPESMLRKMVSAKFLKLFDDEKTPDSPRRDDAPIPALDSVAQSTQSPPAGVDPSAQNKPQLMGPNHDHTDLQLQPNHAAGRPEPGRGAQ